jgi:protein-S-isoprenylcysteine O-methyltransferase Ste14
MMFGSDPIGLPGLAVMGLGFLALLLSVMAARGRGGNTPEDGGGKKSRASWIGILIQGLAIGIVCFGPQRVSLDPSSSLALGEALIIGVLMATGIGLFVSASRTMGQNWSVVARTRSDHVLVTGGPFAYIRHPIYVALFLYMIALSIAFGHSERLLFAVPIYAFGTWFRIVREERLLRDMFGAEYDAYAGRVKRFVPGVF